MYKVSNEIKGIVKKNNDGNWDLVAECSGLTYQQVQKMVDVLNAL
jgi:hypothetical protein